MEFSRILDELMKGKYVVWIDDKLSEALTAEYMESNFVAIVGTVEEGVNVCQQRHEKEREQHGRALTRFRISSSSEDFVCSEDLDEDDVKSIREANNRQN